VSEGMIVRVCVCVCVCVCMCMCVISYTELLRWYSANTLVALRHLFLRVRVCVSVCASVCEGARDREIGRAGQREKKRERARASVCVRV